jgi:group II intron reverse transcriptase/maturase
MRTNMKRPKVDSSEGDTRGATRPTDKVRSLRGKLYVAAKANPTRRFGAIRDRVTRDDVISQAWEEVRRNRGAPGVDGVTIEMVEEQGVEPFLQELQAQLRNGTYRPLPVRRVLIPKRSGGQRALGIPAVRDRVAQAAVKLVIEPIFEADFLPCSYGYRPGRSAQDAAGEVWKWLCMGLENVLDADIKSCFDTIPHDRLLRAVAGRISDGYILKLVKMWLKSGVMVGGGVEATDVGTPQGGVLSPLLSNIYLHRLDAEWERRGLADRHGADAKLIRYADDFVILSSKSVRPLVPVVREVLADMGLSLNEEKSRVVRAERGFDFLGFRFICRRSEKHGKRRTHFFPSPKAVERVKEKVRDRCGNHVLHVEVEDVVRNVNSVLRGWWAYYRCSNASRTFGKVQLYVNHRMRRFLQRRKQKPGLGRYRDASNEFLYGELGLACIVCQGSVRYAGPRGAA